MPDAPTPPPKETRERVCPHCNSPKVMPSGSIIAVRSELRVDYRCGDCSKEFVLLR